MARINLKKTTHKKTKDVVIKSANDGNTYKSYVEDKQRYMICQNSVETGNYFKGHLCGNWTKVSNETVKTLCWKCTARLVPFEEKIVKKSDKPRGWAFMKEYVHKDGTVYHKGIEQPELKGTLEITVIEKKEKVKLTKGQKAEQQQTILRQMGKLKKQHKKETRKTYAGKIMSQIKKLQRDLKKVR
jgi:hypothetical protein